jgi:hypothetical protein
VEGYLECLYLYKTNGSINGDLDLQCKYLEGVCNKLLLDAKEIWRQKSRATWIKSDDKKTKFFHRFVIYKINKKYLWEITDEEVCLHMGHEAIKKEVVTYFNNLFNEHGQSNLQAQMATIELYHGLLWRNKSLL